MKPTVAFAMFALGLAACSGGGTSLPDTPPTPAHSSPPSSPPATATGTVVDFDSNSGLPGVKVAIASPGASPQPVATTSADGSFRFKTAPGQYDVVVGSNSPSDNRASYHFSYDLRSGANVLAAASPNPVPGYPTFPSQLSGNIRLAAMSGPEQLCLKGMNAGRAANGLRALIPDEFLLETARVWVDEELAQSSAEPSTLSGINVLPTQGMVFTTLFAWFPSMQALQCDSWTETQSFTPGDASYQYATNAKATLYGGSQGVLGEAGQSNYSEAGMQTWQ